MPIYTYRCESCGVQFERHQSFNDEPLKRCPECSKNSLRKVLTPAGIIFKGSGWYATDHKSPSGQNRSQKAEGKETGTSASESSGSSEKSEGSGSGDSKGDAKKESSGSSSKSESSSGSTAKTESSSKSSE